MSRAARVLLATALLTVHLPLVVVETATAIENRFPSSVERFPGHSRIIVGDAGATCERAVEVKALPSGSAGTEDGEANWTGGASGDTFDVWFRARRSGTCTDAKVDVGIAIVSLDGPLGTSPIRSSTATLSHATYAQMFLNDAKADMTNWLNLGPLCSTSGCVSYTNSGGTTSTTQWTLASSGSYNFGAATTKLQVGTWTIAATAVWQDSLNNDVITGTYDACSGACENGFGKARIGFLRGHPASLTFRALDGTCTTEDTTWTAGQEVCLEVAGAGVWRHDSHLNKTRVAEYVVSSSLFDAGAQGAACHDSKDLCLVVGRDLLSSTNHVIYGQLFSKASVAVGSPFAISGTMTGSCGSANAPLDVVFAPPSGRWIVGAACSSGGTQPNVFLVDSTGATVASAHASASGSTAVRVNWTTTSTGTLYYAACVIASNAANCYVYDAALGQQGDFVSLCAQSCQTGVYVAGVPGSGAFYTLHDQGSGTTFNAYVKKITAGSTPAVAWTTNILSSTSLAGMRSICATKTHIGALRSSTGSGDMILAVLKSDGTLVEDWQTPIPSGAGPRAHCEVNGDTAWLIYRAGSGLGSVKSLGVALDPAAGAPRKVSAEVELLAAANAEEVRLSGGLAVVAQEKDGSTNGRVHLFHARATQVFDAKVVTPSGKHYGRVIESAPGTVTAKIQIPKDAALNGHAATLHLLEEAQFYGLPWTDVAKTPAGTTTKPMPSVTLTDPDGGTYSVAGYGVENTLQVTVSDVDCDATETTPYCKTGDALSADLVVRDEWGDAFPTGEKVDVVPKFPTAGDATALLKTLTVGAAGAVSYPATTIPAAATPPVAGQPEDTYQSTTYGQSEALDVRFAVNYPSGTPDMQGGYGESAPAWDLDDDLYGAFWTARAEGALSESTTFRIGAHVLYTYQTWRGVRGNLLSGASSSCSLTLDDGHVLATWTPASTNANGQTSTKRVVPEPPPGPATLSCSGTLANNAGTVTREITLLDPGVPDPITIEADVAHLGTPLTLTVHARNLDTSVRTGASASIWITVIHQASGTVVVNAANPTEDADGTYTYTFTPSRLGDHRARVRTISDGMTQGDAIVFRVVYDSAVNLSRIDANHTLHEGREAARSAALNATIANLDADVGVVLARADKILAELRWYHGHYNATEAANLATLRADVADVRDRVETLRGQVLAGLAGQNSTASTRHTELLNRLNGLDADLASLQATLDVHEARQAYRHGAVNLTLADIDADLAAARVVLDKTLAELRWFHAHYNATEAANLATLRADVTAVRDLVELARGQILAGLAGQNTTATNRHNALLDRLDALDADLAIVDAFLRLHEDREAAREAASNMTLARLETQLLEHEGREASRSASANLSRARLESLILSANASAADAHERAHAAHANLTRNLTRLDANHSRHEAYVIDKLGNAFPEPAGGYTFSGGGGGGGTSTYTPRPKATRLEGTAYTIGALLVLAVLAAAIVVVVRRARAQQLASIPPWQR